jgi:hypothetical protein
MCTKYIWKCEGKRLPKDKIEMDQKNNGAVENGWIHLPLDRIWWWSMETTVSKALVP